MPPKMTFTRETILTAAFTLTEEKGIQELSARKIAERLKSSQAPIYSQYKNIEELKNEVLYRAKELLIDYTNKPYTEHPFLNLGVGVAVFSREHQYLFQALSNEKQMMHDLVDIFSELMLADHRFLDIPVQVRQKIINKTTIITFGLADLMAKGFIEDDSDDSIVQTLYELGHAIITAEINHYKKGGM